MFVNPNNICMFRGNVTRDPELRAAGKTQYARFGLAANNYSVKKGEKGSVYFVDCELWGKQAETFVENVKKGQEIWIQSEARLDEWESKTGDKKSKVVYRVSDFRFVGPKKVEENEQGSNSSQKPQEPNDLEPAQDEDVPF